MFTGVGEELGVDTPAAVTLICTGATLTKPNWLAFLEIVVADERVATRLRNISFSRAASERSRSSLSSWNDDCTANTWNVTSRNIDSAEIAATPAMAKRARLR